MVLRPDPRHLGIIPETELNQCPKCAGTGRTPFASSTAKGYYICEVCKGTGINPNPPPKKIKTVDPANPTAAAPATPVTPTPTDKK